jgi:nucleoid-associated protein YgaU
MTIADLPAETQTKIIEMVESACNICPEVEAAAAAAAAADAAPADAAPADAAPADEEAPADPATDAAPADAAPADPAEDGTGGVTAALEPFLNMSVPFEFNESCMVITIIFAILFMYKEEIMKTNLVKKLLK